MKQLTWKLALPLSIISFAVFTKWWYVLPVDAPDTMMTGFPMPYMCPGWHTSTSLQIFVLEFFLDLLGYFVCWLLLIYGVNRFLIKIRVYKVLTIILLAVSAVIASASILSASERNNIIYLKKPWDHQVMLTGYKFFWQYPEWPDFEKYDPRPKGNDSL